MKALLTLARMYKHMNEVRVLEYWPYRTGQMSTPSQERIDAWLYPEEKDSTSYRAALHLQRLAAALTGNRPDNHTCGVFSFRGKVLSVRWSDNNVSVSLGHNVKPGSDYRLGVPYKPLQPEGWETLSKEIKKEKHGRH